MSKKIELMLVSFLLCVAFGLRFFRLSELMPFTFDQGRDMYALLQISRGDITLIGPTTGLQGVFLGPFYFYFLLPGLLLSGGSPIGVAYWVLFWTTISLPLFYYLLKPIVGSKWAMVGFAALCITFGSIDEARVIWNPSLTVPLLLLSFWLLFHSLKKNWLLIPSLFLFGLSLQTELAYAMFIFPAYAWWVIKHWKSYNWKFIFLSTLALSMTLLPQALFELRNNFIMTKSILAPKPADYHISLIEVWQERPTQIADAIQHRVFGAPGYYRVGFIFLLLATLWLAIKRNLKNTERFWVAVFILPIAGLMFHTSNFGNFFPYYVNAHYLPALAIIIIALSKLKNGRVLGSAFAVAMVVLLWRFAQVIYSPTAITYNLSQQLNALRYIREIKQTERPAVHVFVPNMLPINYQYLNEWLAFSNQAAPVDFGVTDQDEYFILYEQEKGSQDYFFKPWYEQWTKEATCSDEKRFGIIGVERCEKYTCPDDGILCGGVMEENSSCSTQYQTWAENNCSIISRQQ